MGAQPAAPDDDDPKFNRMMEMAIAQSLEDSCFDAHLHDLDERELQFGLEQAVAFAEALAVNRDRQRLVWREWERLRRKRLREEEVAAGRPTGTGMHHRRLMFEFEPEEQTDAEAMTAGQEIMASSESATPPHGQGAHARAVATAFKHGMEIVDLISSFASGTY